MTETTTVEVEPTETPDTSSIISAIAKGDTVTAGTSFEDIMKQKMQTALDARRQEFAGQLFSATAPEAETIEQEHSVEEE